MTQNDDPNQQLQTHYAVAVVSFVILYYDYFLSLATEIEHFWPPKRCITWPSILFFCNRYLSLIGSVPVVLEEFYNSGKDELCAPLQTYHHYYITVIQFIVAVMCTLRVSALYNNNPFVIGLLIVISIGVVATASWALHSGTPFLKVDVHGCHPMFPQSEGTHLAITWGSLLGFDLMVFLLTLYKALCIGRKHPGTLFHVILRDGTLYFVILFISNTVCVFAYLHAPPLLKGVTSILANVLSATLLSRLMLNLRVEYSQMNEDRARGEYLGEAE